MLSAPAQFRNSGGTAPISHGHTSYVSAPKVLIDREIMLVSKRLNAGVLESAVESAKSRGVLTTVSAITIIDCQLVNLLAFKNFLAQFDSITAVTISNCGITTIDSLFPEGYHSTLLQLKLTGNAIDSWRGFDGFARLTALNLRSNQLRNFVSFPTRLTALEHLELAYNPLYTLFDVPRAVGYLTGNTWASLRSIDGLKPVPPPKAYDIDAYLLSFKLFHDAQYSDKAKTQSRRLYCRGRQPTLTVSDPDSVSGLTLEVSGAFVGTSSNETYVFAQGSAAAFVISKSIAHTATLVTVADIRVSLCSLGDAPTPVACTKATTKGQLHDTVRYEFTADRVNCCYVASYTVLVTLGNSVLAHEDYCVFSDISAVGTSVVDSATVACISGVDGRRLDLAADYPYVGDCFSYSIALSGCPVTHCDIDVYRCAQGSDIFVEQLHVECQRRQPTDDLPSLEFSYTTSFAELGCSLKFVILPRAIDGSTGAPYTLDTRDVAPHAVLLARPESLCVAPPTVVQSAIGSFFLDYTLQAGFSNLAPASAVQWYVKNDSPTLLELTMARGERVCFISDCVREIADPKELHAVHTLSHGGQTVMARRVVVDLRTARVVDAVDGSAQHGFAEALDALFAASQSQSADTRSADDQTLELSRSLLGSRPDLDVHVVESATDSGERMFRIEADASPALAQRLGALAGPRLMYLLFLNHRLLLQQTEPPFCLARKVLIDRLVDQRTVFSRSTIRVELVDRADRADAPAGGRVLAAGTVLLSSFAAPALRLNRYRGAADLRLLSSDLDAVSVPTTESVVHKNVLRRKWRVKVTRKRPPSPSRVAELRRRLRHRRARSRSRLGPAPRLRSVMSPTPAEQITRAAGRAAPLNMDDAYALSSEQQKFLHVLNVVNDLSDSVSLLSEAPADRATPSGDDGSYSYSDQGFFDELMAGEDTESYTYIYTEDTAQESVPDAELNPLVEIPPPALQGPPAAAAPEEGVDSVGIGLGLDLGAGEPSAPSAPSVVSVASPASPSNDKFALSSADQSPATTDKHSIESLPVRLASPHEGSSFLYGNAPTTTLSDMDDPMVVSNSFLSLQASLPALAFYSGGPSGRQSKYRHSRTAKSMFAQHPKVPLTVSETDGPQASSSRAQSPAGLLSPGAFITDTRPPSLILPNNLNSSGNRMHQHAPNEILDSSGLYVTDESQTSCLNCIVDNLALEFLSPEVDFEDPGGVGRISVGDTVRLTIAFRVHVTLLSKCRCPSCRTLFAAVYTIQECLAHGAAHGAAESPAHSAADAKLARTEQSLAGLVGDIFTSIFLSKKRRPIAEYIADKVLRLRIYRFSRDSERPCIANLRFGGCRVQSCRYDEQAQGRSETNVTLSAHTLFAYSYIVDPHNYGTLLCAVFNRYITDNLRLESNNFEYTTVHDLSVDEAPRTVNKLLSTKIVEFTPAAAHTIMSPFLAKRIAETLNMLNGAQSALARSAQRRGKGPMLTLVGSELSCSRPFSLSLQLGNCTLAVAKEKYKRTAKHLFHPTSSFISESAIDDRVAILEVPDYSTVSRRARSAAQKRMASPFVGCGKLPSGKGGVAGSIGTMTFTLQFGNFEDRLLAIFALRSLRNKGTLEEFE